MAGKIISIVGPMYAGKSESLIRMVNRYTIAKKKCLVIAHSSDNRYSEGHNLCTHSGISIPALKLEKLQLDASPYDVVAIDEGQFFSDLIDFVDEWARKGKIILVSALSADYKMEPFPIVARLLARSEKIVPITAICSECQKSASFTKKINGDGALIDVGGIDKYKATCRKCHASVSNVST
ncbi:Thymidine kinase [Kaumoebavirus]|uniref:thymidine kinase n=1 Tax=Kaumoebavirus TaxID=1859492 RepID=UPI0009C1CFB0|nr:thymidine kinase [Kaumoebavirus]ARA72172.1 Thymidine kinase [Kaumoebavirus]